jgi:hypothetical protein
MSEFILASFTALITKGILINNEFVILQIQDKGQISSLEVQYSPNIVTKRFITISALTSYINSFDYFMTSIALYIYAV